MQRSATIVWLSVFALFGVLSSAYVHRVPGLMGDEASEGENVYEKIVLLKTGGPYTNLSEMVRGERSYIGPAIDYLRMPFVALFGYTALALRLPVLVLSLVTFVLGDSVFRKLFGKKASLLVAVIVFFSPIYLTTQRQGWAITLLPFFALLTLWLLLSNIRGKYFWAGVSAGLGLHNHILFLPTLLALFVPASVNYIRDIWKRKTFRWQVLAPGVSLVLGFSIFFSTQFVALRADASDQGDPLAVAYLVGERATAFFDAAPLYLSGSSYVARYTGAEFPAHWQQAITLLLGMLAVTALAWAKRRQAVWLWALGLVVHLVALLVMIDRLTLRYFTVFSLGVWVLAAIGMAALVSRYRYIKSKQIALGVALLLSSFFITWVLGPWMYTGGSTNDFSLGNRTNSAAALVDIHPLITCLRGQGAVGSENVHIWNRLQFLGHQYTNLTVLPEEENSQADLWVHYRDGKTAVDLEAELCPDLTHFIVENRRRRRVPAEIVTPAVKPGAR